MKPANLVDDFPIGIQFELSVFAGHFVRLQYDRAAGSDFNFQRPAPDIELELYSLSARGEYVHILELKLAYETECSLYNRFWDRLTGPPIPSWFETGETFDYLMEPRVNFSCIRGGSVAVSETTNDEMAECSAVFTVLTPFFKGLKLFPEPRMQLLCHPPVQYYTRLHKPYNLVLDIARFHFNYVSDATVRRQFINLFAH